MTAGKMRCLQVLLNKIWAGGGDDKVVLVSNVVVVPSRTLSLMLLCL